MAEKNTERSSSVHESIVDDIGNVRVHAALLQKSRGRLQNHGPKSAFEGRVFEEFVQIEDPAPDVLIFELQPVQVALRLGPGILPTQLPFSGGSFIAFD